MKIRNLFVEAARRLNKIVAPKLERMPPDRLADNFFNAVSVAGQRQKFGPNLKSPRPEQSMPGTSRNISLSASAGRPYSSGPPEFRWSSLEPHEPSSG